MLRQVSSRNQRAKGLRVKHVLQISLLLAISIWLLYQVMHSHGKKSTYEERNSKSAQKLDESQANIFKVGRKDLPHTVETDSATESRNKEEVNGEVGDVERENMLKETEDGGGGVGNNKIDKQDQEKVEEEVDHGKEIADEEDKNGQVDELDLLKDQELEELSHEAREKSFKGDDASSAVVHNPQVKEHEERYREAQEMRFKGDDASSAVAHDAEVEEHEAGSYEEREKSFQDDDASSAVEQDIQVSKSKSENGGSGGVDEKRLDKMARKEIENETVTSGTIDGLRGNDSSVSGLDISNTHVSSAIHEDTETTPNNYPTINGNAVEKSESDVGAYPKLVDESSSNSTTGKSNNNTEHQADLPTVDVIGSQSELRMNSTNNEMELQTSSTMFSDKREPQMNSTTVTDQSESEINMMVVDRVTNGAPQQHESATLDSVQDRNATVKMVTLSENKSNLQNIVMEKTENFNTTVKPEESGGISTTSSATNENGETASAESGNASHNAAARDNGDANTLQSIKTKAESGGEEAVVR